MWLAIILVVLLVTLVLVAYAYRFINNNTVGAQFYLSVLLVYSIIVLLVFLTFSSVVFKYIGMADPTQALGLPEGSIRAVIALGLILIFMISSLYLYGAVEKSGEMSVQKYTNITQKQLDEIPQDEIAYIQRTGVLNNETLFNVGRMLEKSSASEDIAKQIITTLSTLVVAVAGFYFGSKAVSGVGGGVSAVPVIRSVHPPQGARKEEIELKIYGKNFELVRGVALVRDSIEIECTDVTSNSTLICCKLKIPKDEVAYPGGPDNKWTIIVKSSDIGQDRLDGVFTIIQG